MPIAIAPVYPAASSSTPRKQLKITTDLGTTTGSSSSPYAAAEDFSSESLYTISPSPSPTPTPTTVPAIPLPCSSVPPGPHAPPPSTCLATRSILRIGERGRKRLRVTFELPEDYADVDSLEEVPVPVPVKKEWRKQYGYGWEYCGYEDGYEDTTAPTWGAVGMDVDEDEESEVESDDDEEEEEEEEEVVVYRNPANPPIRHLQANHGIDEDDSNSDSDSDMSMSLDDEPQVPSSSSPTPSTSIYNTFSLSPVRQNYRYAPMVMSCYDLEDCMDVGNEYSSGDDSDSESESRSHVTPTSTPTSSSPPSYDSEAGAGAFCGPLHDLIHSDPSSPIPSSPVLSSESGTGTGTGTPESGWSRSTMQPSFDGHRDRGFTFNSSW